MGKEHSQSMDSPKRVRCMIRNRMQILVVLLRNSQSKCPQICTSPKSITPPPPKKKIDNLNPHKGRFIVFERYRHKESAYFGRDAWNLWCASPPYTKFKNHCAITERKGRVFSSQILVILLPQVQYGQNLNRCSGCFYSYIFTITIKFRYLLSRHPCCF